MYNYRFSFEDAIEAANIELTDGIVRFQIEAGIAWKILDDFEKVVSRDLSVLRTAADNMKDFDPVEAPINHSSKSPIAYSLLKANNMGDKTGLGALLLDEEDRSVNDQKLGDMIREANRARALVDKALEMLSDLTDNLGERAHPLFFEIHYDGNKSMTLEFLKSVDEPLRKILDKDADDFNDEAVKRIGRALGTEPKPADDYNEDDANEASSKDYIEIGDPSDAPDAGKEKRGFHDIFKNQAIEEARGDIVIQMMWAMKQKHVSLVNRP